MLPTRVEQGLDAELRFEIDSRVEALVASGVDELEARRRVRLEFGGIDQIKEECRDARFVAVIDSLLWDLRYAVRVLRDAPGFTIVAILSLAIGIGANTAIFSLLDQVILRPLPGRDPQELVAFRSFGPNPGMDRNSGLKMSFSWPKYKAFRNKAQCFSGVAARYADGAALSYGNQTDRVFLELVSGNYFNVLGVGATVGRVLSPEDDRTWKAEPWIVLSHEYWTRRFGANPAVIGQPVRLNDTMMTVIGVAARDFHGMQRGVSFDAWAPMMMKPFVTPNWPWLNSPMAAWLNIVARVKAGVPPQQAEAEANVLYRQLLRDEAGGLSGVWARQKEEFLRRKLDLLPGSHGLTWNTERMRTTFVSLFVMAGAVLLIACVNVAGLLLARSVARQREIGIRAALGADRMRLARQFLCESTLLAACGAALGLGLAVVAGRPLVILLLGEDALRLYSAAPDARVLAFALAALVLTILLFGVALPAHAVKVRTTAALRSGTGLSGGTRSATLRKALVAVQLAACIVLTTGAVLFGRTMQNLQNVDLGFDANNLITFSADATLAGYGERTPDVYRRIEQRLATLPGVVSAGVSGYGVLKGNTNISRYVIEGFRSDNPEDNDIREIAVTPAYMESLGLRLAAGRMFTEADASTPRVAIVNKAFARRYYQGADPIGRSLKPVFANHDLTLAIVGMIADEKYLSVREDTQPAVYVPNLYAGSATFYIRTALAENAVVPGIRKAVNEEAPNVPVYNICTMKEQVDSGLRAERMAAALAVCFGVIALVLATVGLYGVIAYLVGARTREIGLRIAVGASRSDVFSMVMRDVAVVVAPGGVAGIPAALLLSRRIESTLYGVTPADPASIGIALGVCIAVATVAGAIPAVRAMRVDPVRTLRWE